MMKKFVDSRKLVHSLLPAVLMALMLMFLTTALAGDIDLPDPSVFQFTILKMDGDTGEPLPGAEFELTDEDGTPIATGTTDEEGIVILPLPGSAPDVDVSLPKADVNPRDPEGTLKGPKFKAAGPEIDVSGPTPDVEGPGITKKPLVFYLREVSAPKGYPQPGKTMVWKITFDLQGPIIEPVGKEAFAATASKEILLKNPTFLSIIQMIGDRLRFEQGRDYLAVINRKGTVPKTGDDFSPALWGGLMLISTVLGAGLLSRGRRSARSDCNAHP